jgi:hypothetical protein
VDKLILLLRPLCGAVLLLCTVVMASAAPAQQQSAQAFVEAIYKSYLGKDAKGVELVDEAAVRRYFAPPLADAIIKDFTDAEKRNEAPTLDGDPFIDAQDYEITALKVAVKTAGANAVATVNFTNFDKPVTITLDLVTVSGAWRIADIKAPSGSLKVLLKVT